MYLTLPECKLLLMATKSKRITVYLTEDAYNRVARTSRATDESMASTIAQLVESAAPMLDRVADLAEAIRDAPEDVRATFAGAALQLEEQYGGLLAEAQAGAMPAEADEFWQALQDAAMGQGSHPVIREPEK
jgi:hypothetical protein